MKFGPRLRFSPWWWLAATDIDWVNMLTVLTVDLNMLSVLTVDLSNSTGVAESSLSSEGSWIHSAEGWWSFSWQLFFFVIWFSLFDTVLEKRKSPLLPCSLRRLDVRLWCVQRSSRARDTVTYWGRSVLRLTHQTQETSGAPGVHQVFQQPRHNRNKQRGSERDFNASTADQSAQEVYLQNKLHWFIECFDSRDKQHLILNSEYS